MALLNYRTKIWTKITQTTNQGPDGQKKTRKKTKALTMRTKKKLSGHFFWSGQKGIYHQVEFCPGYINVGIASDLGQGKNHAPTRSYL